MVSTFVTIAGKQGPNKQGNWPPPRKAHERGEKLLKEKAHVQIDFYNSAKYGEFEPDRDTVTAATFAAYSRA